MLPQFRPAAAEKGWRRQCQLWAQLCGIAGRGGQGPAWLCCRRRVLFPSLPHIPKPWLWSSSVGVAGGAQGFGLPLPFIFLGFLFSRGHTSMAESALLSAPAAVNLSFTGKENTTGGSPAGA